MQKVRVVHTSSKSLCSINTFGGIQSDEQSCWPITYREISWFFNMIGSTSETRTCESQLGPFPNKKPISLLLLSSSSSSSSSSNLFSLRLLTSTSIYLTPIYSQRRDK